MHQERAVTGEVKHENADLMKNKRLLWRGTEAPSSRMTGFEIHQLKDLADFAANGDFQMHITQGFHTIWHSVLFSDGRNVYIVLIKLKKLIF